MAKDPHPGEREPARIELASAIASEAGARRDMRAAEEAMELASDRRWDAESKLAAIREANAASHGGLGSEFIRRVQAGDACDAAVLERPSAEASAKEAEAQRAVAVWKQTRDECDLALSAKGTVVANAKECIERAARKVIANPEIVERLMAGIEDMQRALIDRRLSLRYVLFKGTLSDPDKERVQRFLREHMLPGGIGCVEYENWDGYPVSVLWADAFKALMLDADAGLPL